MTFDRIHASHAISVVDVAFDTIEDEQTALDTAVVILAMMIGCTPPPARRAIAERLCAGAIDFLEHINA